MPTFDKTQRNLTPLWRYYCRIRPHAHNYRGILGWCCPHYCGTPMLPRYYRRPHPHAALWLEAKIKTRYSCSRRPRWGAELSRWGQDFPKDCLEIPRAKVFKPRGNVSGCDRANDHRIANWATAKTIHLSILCWMWRCIKPNANKSSDLFDDELVLKQLKYTGVMETVKIRRQGFAFRLPFETFIHR